MNLKKLSPLNPLDYLRLLWWLLVMPQYLKAYRETFGDEKLVAKWLVSTIALLPLLVVTLAVPPRLEFGLWISLVLIGVWWLLTVWLEKIEVDKNRAIIVTIMIFMTAIFVLFVDFLMNFRTGFKEYGMAVNVAIVVAFLVAGSVTYGIVVSVESFVAGIVAFIIAVLIAVEIVAAPDVIKIAVEEAYNINCLTVYGRDDKIMIIGVLAGIFGTQLFGVGFIVAGPVVAGQCH